MDGDGRAWILEEFYQPRCSIETLVQEARRLRERWGEGTFYCDPAEPRGINEFVQAGLDAVSNKTKRDDGIREVGGRFADAGDGRPRIFVHSSCVNWIAEVQSYDESAKQFDHAMDATRYALANASDLRGEIEVYFGKRPP